jgi:ketosteroid isomerase-like protein
MALKNKDEEPQTEINKYIHIWKKQHDGTWHVLIDIVNRRTPPCE